MVELCVIAQPCEIDGLTSPHKRHLYKYIELKSQRFLGLSFQFNMLEVLKYRKWDIICVDFNLRQIMRLYLFIKHIELRPIWVWWGHLIGSKENFIFCTLRAYFFKYAAGCLGYNTIITNKVKKINRNSLSINNNQASTVDFRDGLFQKHNGINLLFVGRYQKRKKLERLISIAERNSDIRVRVIGPNMESLSVPNHLQFERRIEKYPKTEKELLNPHFDWADIVISPGHVGLLVSNTALHGKGIVIDKNSRHAPEYLMALEADQPFIDFGNISEVDEFFHMIRQAPECLKVWAEELQKIGKSKYSLEYMVKQHELLFKQIVNRR